MIKSKIKFSFVTTLSSLVILSCNLSSDKKEDEKNWECQIKTDESPNFSTQIGCEEDFQALSSEPLDASIPGAISLKTVVDLEDGEKLYFQNSQKYQIHWDFTSTNLSGDGKPIVPPLSQFNQTEYYSPNRRFILGSITYYESSDTWAYEIAPYDNASAEMIALALGKIMESAYFGEELKFHPTSLTIELEAKKLSSEFKTISTQELFKDITYQPLNYGKSLGRLIFITAKELETEYVGFRDIVVLDAVPNDISVVNGIITQEFQTPLSHINVLSQNRGTPNMGLKEAFNDPELRALEDKWVELEVSAFDFSIKEVTAAEADAWWEDHKPEEVQVPNLDLDTKELRDIENILDLENLSLGEALKQAIPAYGGKASHFAAFPHMDNEKVPYPKAFGIPVYYYWQFMEQNGFNQRVDEFLADSQFQANPTYRDLKLKALRADMMDAPLDSAFETELMEKLNNEYPGIKMRFRSSTNAEDLDGFTGAGLYTSKSGDPNDPSDPVDDAIREVWASVWYFRAFEERSYRNIDHQTVGMALLVHNSFPDEEANGVAITANPFDPTGSEPGFYVNVQEGEASVVQPDVGITTDQFVYHFDMPGQPIVFIAHSSLVPEGQNVLTTAQTYKLGIALKEIHRFFMGLYGSDPNKWYAMDTEFKFDQPIGADPNSEPKLIMKQARPYPGWGSNQ